MATSPTRLWERNKHKRDNRTPASEISILTNHKSQKKETTTPDQQMIGDWRAPIEGLGGPTDSAWATKCKAGLR